MWRKESRDLIEILHVPQGKRCVVTGTSIRTWLSFPVDRSDTNKHILGCRRYLAVRNSWRRFCGE